MRRRRGAGARPRILRKVPEEGDKQAAAVARGLVVRLQSVVRGDLARDLLALVAVALLHSHHTVHRVLTTIHGAESAVGELGEQLEHLSSARASDRLEDHSRRGVDHGRRGVDHGRR
eukprot:3797929-Prymnesium_polylepis.2